MKRDLRSDLSWLEKPLDHLDADEWEALCDGCGRCCLVKLEDEDTGEIHPTSVACRLLDTDTCRCKHYDRRFELVSDCLDLDPSKVAEYTWLPTSCAYRLRYEGKPLPDWHPLLSGSPDTVVEAGISVSGRTVSEDTVPEEELGNYLLDWPNSAENETNEGGK